MAVHTQYVFLKKNKRKNIHVAFQNEEKILYFFVVAGVIEKFRPGRVWFLQMGGGKCFPIDLWQDLSLIIFPVYQQWNWGHLMLFFPLVSPLNAFVTARWGIIYSAKQF